MTPRQEAMVAFIREYIAEHGYSPTIREISGHGYASTAAINNQLYHLRDAGIVAFEDGKARTIRVLP